jgi:hypothetical protein
LARQISDAVMFHNFRGTDASFDTFNHFNTFYYLDLQELYPRISILWTQKSIRGKLDFETNN